MLVLGGTIVLLCLMIGWVVSVLTDDPPNNDDPWA
jgi:hypothetical protein